MLGSRKYVGSLLAVTFALLLMGTVAIVGLWAHTPPSEAAPLQSELPFPDEITGESFNTLRVYGDNRGNELTFPGTLDNDDLTFSRPFETAPCAPVPATAVFYDAYTVRVGGPVQIEMNALSSGDGTLTDPFVVVYEDFFNPATPCDNFVAANDNGGLLLDSELSIDLTHGVYVVVATSSGNGDTGTYRLTIEELTGNHGRPGDTSVTDPRTGLTPEDAPYTEHEAPFDPQHDQAPVKDSVTWNPAWMFDGETFDENQEDGLYARLIAAGHRLNGATFSGDIAEKVWFRMWYEPEHWDKDIEADSVLTRDPETREPLGPINPSVQVHDEWYPAIMQEFTYLITEGEPSSEAPEPIFGRAGETNIVFPVGMREADLFDASGNLDTSPDADFGYGLTSFDGDFDGIPDIVHVESEITLETRYDVEADFDGDGVLDRLDSDGIRLSGDELVALRLDEKEVTEDQYIQFLDHVVRLQTVTDNGFSVQRAQLEIAYTGSRSEIFTDTITIDVGDMALAGTTGVQRIEASDSAGDYFPTGPFFAILTGVDGPERTATLVVGRALGASHSGMEDSPRALDDRPGDPWFLKRFYVDGHEYNVVAINTNSPEGFAQQDDPTEFQYITIRTPIPKLNVEIEQHSVKLQGYQLVTGTNPSELKALSVMPPFNHEHYILEDVSSGGGGDFGPAFGPVPPILQENGPFPYDGVYQAGTDTVYDNIREMALFYVEETTNPQFLGQLKEKYGEIPREEQPENEFWYVEQFFTQPWQYTEFVFPDIQNLDELYLLTSAFSSLRLELLNSHTFDWVPESGGGVIEITENVYNNCFGNPDLYRWEYLVRNDGFEPDPGNGLSGFRVNFPQPIPDLGFSFRPEGWDEERDPNDEFIEWEIFPPDSGIQDGESGVFGFCTDPRADVVIPEDSPNASVMFTHDPTDNDRARLFNGPLSVPGGLLEDEEVEANPRVKFWFDPSEGLNDPTEPVKKYKDENGLRVYGEGDEGAGELVTDPASTVASPTASVDLQQVATGTFPVEVRPYTDPMAPFNPLLDQAPEKDSLTFNPAFLAHGFTADEGRNSFYRQIRIDGGDAREKAFFRMWYEPQYLDKILEGSVITTSAGITEVAVADAYRFPALLQEFTYMLLDQSSQPNHGQPSGDRQTALAFPMATGFDELFDEFGYGLTSFDANFDGAPDITTVHSENSLSKLTDIDADFNWNGTIDELDVRDDREELSGDELVVLTVEEFELGEGEHIQFLDHMATLENTASPGTARFQFWTTRGDRDQTPRQIEGLQTLSEGSMVVVRRNSVTSIPPGGSNTASTQPGGDGAWFLYLHGINVNTETAIVTVGRALGATHSAIDTGLGFGNHDLERGDMWFLKRFFVDGHEYNVVAIKTVFIPEEQRATGEEGYEFKYITIRTPVPKVEFENNEDSIILEGYFRGEVTVDGTQIDTDVISVMPPFNMQHTRMNDILKLKEEEFANPDFYDPDCGVGVEDVEADVPALDIRIEEEAIEPQFTGGLSEILNLDESDGWRGESFHTLPDQYTDLQLPEGQLYLLTSSWRSDQSEVHFYSCETPSDFDDPDRFDIDFTQPLRMMFWYDPADVDDIYVNRFTFTGPAIQITKSPDLRTVISGSDAAFTIAVTNTGGISLTNVTVNDPLAPDCDRSIGDLAVNASDSYLCTLANVTADLTNSATVTGATTAGVTVTNTDTADVDVIGPSIQIDKTPDFQQATSGSDVTFTIHVTNTGDVDLTDVTVTDAQVPDCDASLGTLAVGDSDSYACTATNVTSDFTNSATATGTHPVGTVSDTDTATVDVTGPSVQIDKTPDFQQVTSGSDVSFTIHVTNTGDVDLTGVTVTDSQVPDCDASLGTLAVGDSDSYTCTETNVTADFTNSATATGTHPVGTVSDSDTATVDVIGPSIQIEKTPDFQQVTSGSDVTFSIVVTNDGNVELSNVAVTDAQVPDCDASLGTLAVGDSNSYTCTETNVTADFTNSATATGGHATGTVSDSDTAVVDVVDNLTCSIVGNVFMQGRTNHAGINISASGPVQKATTTISDGSFTLTNVPVGDYIVTASHSSYLSRQDNSVQCQAGQTIQLDHTTLLGGDTNNDKAINLIDLVTVAAAFDTCAGDDLFVSGADINGTSCIDIFDLVLVAVNYGRTGIVAWEADMDPLTSALSKEMQVPALREPSDHLQAEAERFDLEVENVRGLYGIDVKLSFDASEVTVVDADPDRQGVQIELGPLFAGSQYFMAKNQVTIDKETGVGTVDFVASLRNPAEPISGRGTIASILLESAESSDFTIEKAFLVNQRGRKLSVKWEGNTIRQVFPINLPVIVR